MFSLLNPFALWLAPLLAAPLLIHFLGRSQPKLKDFPSLLPVQGRLTQAMRRHRVKNWLQLLLRTLALLFLMLAAMNPLLRPRQGFTPPAAAGLLIHNGAFGAVPLPQGGTVLDAGQRMQHSLDSLTLGHSRAELLLPDAPSRGEASARFGSYPDAVARLLRNMRGQSSFHLHLPVFDWRDLDASRELLVQSLQQNSQFRIVLSEYPEAREHLIPFSGFNLHFPKENIAALRAATHFSVHGSTQTLWTPLGGTPREIKLGNDSAEVLLPLSQAGWLNGTLSMPPPLSEQFAFPAAAISANIPPPMTLCHVSAGGGFASLASLGQGGLRLRIQSFTDAHAVESERCDFLYLANPKEVDASLLGRAGEIARSGGKVIVSLGSNADLALLNRTFLEPLGVGRLTDLKRHAAVKAEPQIKAFSALGIHAASWGEPGEVKIHIGFLRDTGAVVLLSVADDPILVYRRVGKGALLLWTTDVDDPEWTDVGLGPWVALIHQAFASGSWSAKAGIQWVASDSTFLLPASESEQAQATDPSGSPFSQLRRDPDGWRIGPFDHPGLYHLELHREKETDTSWLAVGLAENRLQPDPEAKERVLAALEPFRSRILIHDAGDDWRNIYGGTRLRIPMLIIAALLLLLEGVVSLRLRPAPLPVKRD